jgi:hypothetical protein
MQELAARLHERPSGDLYAGAHSLPDGGEEAEELDAGDLLEEEDAAPATDRHELADLAAASDYADEAVEGSRPGLVTHRGTEPLPSDEGAGYAAYPTAQEVPGAEPAPLTAQPTMIYREPEGPSGRLVVVSGNDRGREYPLALAEITCGRGAENEVVLADIAVSRRHISLFRDGAGFALRDLHSGNGTFVNGRRVQECPLADGDQIEIGSTVMRFVVTGGAAAAAAAPPRPPAPLPPSRVMAPTAPAPQHVMVAPETEPFGMAPLAGYAPVAASPPAADAPVVAPPRPARAAGPLGRLTATRQGKLLTFGGLALCFFLVGAAFVKKVVLPRRQAAAAAAASASQAAPPEELYAEGTKKFRDGDWEGAKQSFESVLAQVPDFQGAKKYSERCDVEMKSRAGLAAAKKALAAKDFAAAKSALQDVDAASKAAEEAGALQKTIPARQIEVLLAAAKQAREEDDIPTAKAKVEEALAVQPDHAEALALRAEYDKARPKTEKEKARERAEREKAEKRAAATEAKAKAKADREAAAAERKAAAAEKLSPKERAAAERKAKAEEAAEKKRAAREEKARKAQEATAEKARQAEAEKQRKLAAKAEKDKRDKKGKEPAEDKGPAPTGPVNDKVAMTHYRNREWGMAIATLKAMAEKQKGKAQAKTLAMADDIRKLGQAFNRAEADAQRNPVAAIRGYEQAAAIDRRIGKGAHASYLSQKLAKLTRAEAQRAVSSGKYELAYELVRSAQRYGGEDAQTRAVSQSLEARAKELFERGYQVKGQKPDEAKALWRRVLKMVPSSSQWYGKAYKYLNEGSGQRQRDEDE